MNGLYSDWGFKFSELVEAQRGMSPAEADLFLATGETPDLSQPPRPEEETLGDFPVLSDVDARSYLAGYDVLTASATAFVDLLELGQTGINATTLSASSEPEQVETDTELTDETEDDVYTEDLIEALVANGFDPSQYRGSGGRWAKKSGKSDDSEEGDWSEASGMSKEEWDKLSPAQRGAIYASAFIAARDGVKGADSVKSKLEGWGKKGGGGGGGGGGAKKAAAKKAAPKKKAAPAKHTPPKHTKAVKTTRAKKADPVGQVAAKPAYKRGDNSLDLIADAEEMKHTGAMIALIPANVDELALEGGEAPDELHMTILFLGEAVMIPEETQDRLVDIVEMNTKYLPTVIGNAFAINAFNPAGEQPCVVLGLSGAQLEAVHDIIESAVIVELARVGVEIPDQHRPWIPHVTMVYEDPDNVDLSALRSKLGPITFDTVRLSFGDTNYDIPLGDTEEQDVLEMIAAGWDPEQQEA